MGSIAAYNYCHSQVQATAHALAAFRQHYPAAPIFVHNDGGHNTAAEAAAAVNATYTYFEENLTTGNGIMDIEVMIRWFERFADVVAKIDTKWLLNLEDDVLIIGKVNTAKLLYDLNGYNPNALLPQAVCDYIRSLQPETRPYGRLPYGGCGGCILNVPLLKRIFESDWKKHVYAYAELSKVNPGEQTWYHNDCILTFLVYAYGGTVGGYDEYCDLKIDQPMGNEKVIHSYKRYYV
jgi:hypothetical protein